MKPSLYIETSVISYLTSQISKDKILAGRQLVTREWWKAKRKDFKLYISEAVITEISRGDSVRITSRLEAVRNLQILLIDEATNELVQRILDSTNYPATAFDDAVHIAISIVNQLDFILTWNFRHIANPTLWNKIKQIANQFGYSFPIICTPSELLGG